MVNGRASDNEPIGVTPRLLHRTARKTELRTHNPVDLALVNFRYRQRGLGLLLTFVVLILAASYFFLDYLSPARLKVERDRRSQELLYSARDALLAYSLSASGASQRPGDMLRPDVIADSPATRNYNGDAETGCLDATRPDGLPLQTDEDAGAKLRCLGRLPWRSLGLSHAAFSENDVTGVMPWYAVSANLAAPNCLEFLNSDILAFSYVGFICPEKRSGDAPTTLPYPWLTVRDAAGAVLSNRAAVVIIMPGPAINGQSRPTPPNLVGPDQYLEATTLTVTAVTPECASPPCTLTFSNADLDNDFIQAEVSETFNDRLLYITIDELMSKLEDRVGLEVKAAVQRFSQTYSPAGMTSYPWLAPFANPNDADNFYSVPTTRVGLIPFHSVGRPFTSDFTWLVSSSSTISRSGTVTDNAVRNTAGLVVPNGTCTWRTQGPRSVDCQGVITNPAVLPPTVTSRRVSITYPTTGTITSTPNPATASTVATRQVVRTTPLAACLSTPNSCVTVEDFHDDDLTDDAMEPDPTPPTLVGSGMIIGGTGPLSTSGIRVYPELPLWYGENRWNELVLGAVSEAYAPNGAGMACDVAPGARCISVTLDSAMERSDVKFLTIVAGRSLAATTQKLTPQIRPSGDPKDYYDTAANVDLVTGLTFDRKALSSGSFNDRLFY